MPGGIEGLILKAAARWRRRTDVEAADKVSGVGFQVSGKENHK